MDTAPGTPQPAWKNRYLTGTRDLRAKALPLERYLRDKGQLLPLELRVLLDELDWTALRPPTLPAGRCPHPPDVMVGLYLYALLIQAKPTVRNLARLARTDLGAWHVCLGLEPSYSTIAKFFVKHADALSEDFVLSVTAQLRKRLELKASELLAIDGTVIEAAASRHRLLSRKSAAKRRRQLEDALDEAPDDVHLQRQLRRVEQAQQAVAEREKNPASAAGARRHGARGVRGPGRRRPAP